MNRVCEATLSTIQHFWSGPTVQLYISEEVSTDDFKSLPEAVKVRIGGSILSTEVQVRIGTVRTDLDRFSDEEAALIRLHGYEVASSELSKKLNESHLSKYIAKLAEPNAKFPSWNQSTVSAVTLLDKSKRRSYGVFRFHDLSSYVNVFLIAAWIAVIAILARWFLR